MTARSGPVMTWQASSPAALVALLLKDLKSYAREAGIEKIHIHQTRHTFARIISEETGSIVETQDALGHKNLATTRVYIGRVAVNRDKHSKQITKRLNILR